MGETLSKLGKWAGRTRLPTGADAWAVPWSLNGGSPGRDGGEVGTGRGDRLSKGSALEKSQTVWRTASSPT